jgi:uncharacterized protein with PQ loop repeat
MLLKFHRFAITFSAYDRRTTAQNKSLERKIYERKAVQVCQKKWKKNRKKNVRDVSLSCFVIYAFFHPTWPFFLAICNLNIENDLSIRQNKTPTHTNKWFSIPLIDHQKFVVVYIKQSAAGALQSEH